MSADRATPPLREDAANMLRRVTLEAGAVLPAEDVVAVRAALAAALEVRDAACSDDDPRYLHPARTILILLSDGACRDADSLAAAAFAESLPGSPLAEPAVLTTRATSLLSQLPPAGLPDDDLLEALVIAPHEVALIAIAERLDHARHLHMMRDVEALPFHRQAEHVYVPLAARTNQRIFARFDKWAGAYARRRLGRR